MKTQPVLTVEREMLDVTMSGIFGHPPSHGRELAPGLIRYFADGVEVTEDEFRRVAMEAGADVP